MQARPVTRPAEAVPRHKYKRWDTSRRSKRYHLCSSDMPFCENLDDYCSSLMSGNMGTSCNIAGDDMYKWVWWSWQPVKLETIQGTCCSRTSLKTAHRCTCLAQIQNCNRQGFRGGPWGPFPTTYLQVPVKIQSVNPHPPSWGSSRPLLQLLVSREVTVALPLAASLFCSSYDILTHSKQKVSSVLYSNALENSIGTPLYWQRNFLYITSRFLTGVFHLQWNLVDTIFMGT